MDLDLTQFTDFLQTLDLKCSRVIKHYFYKNETITTYIENRKQLCILLNR